MMRTKKFLYNSISAAVLQTANMIIGFLLSSTILSYYGSEINGLVMSLTQFVGYFALVEAGISESVIFSLYKPLSQSDNRKISAIFIASKNYFYKTGVFFLILVLLLAILYPFFIRASVMKYYEIMLLTFIIGVNGIVDFFIVAKYRILLTADQRMYVLSIAVIISNILNLLIIMILSAQGCSIVFVRLMALFSVLLRSLILYLYVKCKYGFLDSRVKPDISALSKRWDAFYLQMLGVFQHGVPIVLATIFTDLKNVSVYSVYMLIISSVKSLLSIFQTGLPAAFGEIIVTNDQVTLKKTEEQFECIYYALLRVFYTVTFVLILPFISIYTSNVSDIVYENKALALLFVIDGFFYNMKTPQGMLVISAGLYKETKLQTTIQALIILFVGGMLAPSFKLYGILIGSICSNIYRTIDLLFFIPKYVTHNNILMTFKRQINAVIFLFLGVFLTYYIKLPIVKTYVSWGCLAVKVFLFVSFFSFLDILFTDGTVFKNIFLRVKKLFR